MELFQVIFYSTRVPYAPSDRLLFQSSLLKYTEFSPPEHSECTPSPEPRVLSNPVSNQSRTRPFRWWSLRSSSRDRIIQRKPSQTEARPAREKRQTRPVKRVPVFFLDEAHKLYALSLSSSVRLKDAFSPGLIQSVEAMKALLDSMLVLTKQDRLCHVIHATSDPFYQTWLRQLNVMQHCKVRATLQPRGDTDKGCNRLLRLAIAQKRRHVPFLTKKSHLESQNGLGAAWSLRDYMRLLEGDLCTFKITSPTMVSTFTH
jgi:hypothetical protein